MRSLPVTALLVLVAFVLGLALGGQTPREATAQEEPDLGWDMDGDTLILVNNTTENGYLVRGSFLPGSTTKIPPAFTQGILKMGTQDLGGMTIYQLSPLFECDGLGCRSCDDVPTLCEMPPRPIPFNHREFLTAIGERW